MIFSEIYGSYFKTVSAILARAAEGTLTGRELTSSVWENAFGESMITIPTKLRDGSWPLLTEDFGTPLRHKPHTPLTTLEKQWLKALLLDPRVQLFAPSEAGLENVEPLFTPEQFVYFDRCADGDDFADPAYVERFRTILRAMREGRQLHVEYRGQRGTLHRTDCIPYKLEYSSRDDKFRLLAGRGGKAVTIKLSRIDALQMLGPRKEKEHRAPRERTETLVLELEDSRNALERAMLHFSDLEKETEKLAERHYRITLHYRGEDETELLIRILSFGPMLRLVEPESLAERLRERLRRQLRLSGAQK